MMKTSKISIQILKVRTASNILEEYVFKINNLESDISLISKKILVIEDDLKSLNQRSTNALKSIRTLKAKSQFSFYFIAFFLNILEYLFQLYYQKRYQIRISKRITDLQEIVDFAYRPFPSDTRKDTKTHKEKAISTHVMINDTHFTKLNEELERLCESLKTEEKLETVLSIQMVLIELRDLASLYLKKISKQIKILGAITTHFYFRNTRLIFRAIVQFLFKNLDDESHDVIVSLKATVINHSFTLKQALYEFQGKSYYSLKRGYLF